uniref:PHD finger protein 11 n=1 Tax=Nothobranchius korthausae TaxID=1143690 RepID=A0A1A8EVE3_9TELE
MLMQTSAQVAMTRDRFTCCVLCERSEETKITGALSTKAGLTAHQNCLLFASGLACTSDKPEFDDLFGFPVEEVKKEVKRGRKLSCFRCKKRGAVSGCDVKRCQKSFHFPCAVEDEAEIIENSGKEEFRLFCFKHSHTNSVNEFTKSQSPNNSKKARRSQHAPSSYKRKSNGESSAGQRSPSVSSSSTSLAKSTSSKRRLSYSERSETKKKKAKRLHSDSSSNSDPGALIPPIESDLDESTPPLSEEKTLRFARGPSNSRDSEIPIGDRVEEVVTSDVKNHDVSIHSDAESESLLPLVFSHGQLQPNQEVICLEKEVQTIKRELDFSPAPSPTHSLEKLADEPVPEAPPSQWEFSPIPASSRCTSSSIELAVCEPTCVTYISSSYSSPVPASDPPVSPLEELPSDPNPPQAPPSDPDPINSAGFWRKCNVARCTQALFSEFIKEMNEICRRIQSDQASQEDYDNALSVMKASGRLKAFVDKQQEELQRKQAELQEAAAAMKDVVSGASVLMG